MLVLTALSSSDAELQNLSYSDDTRVLQEALGATTEIRDVGHAGTAMRFLAAYFTVGSKRILLTGSERMKQRPLGPLVKALRELGADIAYAGNDGFPPVWIQGGLKKGGSVEVDSGISSQFISALMMIGPVLSGGLHLRLRGEVVSGTYLQMTMALMREGGIDIQAGSRDIRIAEGAYAFRDYAVEADWSAASYWYQVAALQTGSVISLPYLKAESLQGDAALRELFNPLGVESVFSGGKLRLSSGPVSYRGIFKADCTGFPDLVQTLAATLCALGIPFYFTGTRTLRVKETDRIAALQMELGKLGYVLKADEGGDWLRWDGERTRAQAEPVIRTYDDHRMAMAFAPLACRFGKIIIEDPMVVSKSYPEFWTDLQKAGFSLSSCP